MANYCILRIKKLHSNSNVGGAISHHLRTRETENADPERIEKNWYYPNQSATQDMFTNIEFRKQLQRQAMANFKANLPQKIRKNGVRCVEFMMTVSPEVMQREDFNPVKYLNDCGNWVREKFGKENVFFIAHHMDETTPHISILMTPIDENGKLNARKFFGGREKMSQLQDDFYQKVGFKHGLDRGIKGSKAHHKTIKQYYTELNDFDNNVKKVADEIYLNIPKKKPLFQSENDWKKDIYKAIFYPIKPLARQCFVSQEQKKELDSVKTELSTVQNSLEWEKKTAIFEAKKEVKSELNSKDKEINELKKALETAQKRSEDVQKEFKDFKKDKKKMQSAIKKIDEKSFDWER